MPGAANDPRYDDPRYDDPRLGDSLPEADEAWYAELRGNDPRSGDFGYGPAQDGGPGYGGPGYNQPQQFDQRQQFDQPQQFDQRQQFDMPYDEEPGYEQPRPDGPSYDETRFDLPPFDDQRGYGPPGPGYRQPEYDGGPAYDETRFDMPALGAPVEPGGSDVDVYRDPDFAGPAYGPGPGAGPFGPGGPGPAGPGPGMGRGPAGMGTGPFGPGPAGMGPGPVGPGPGGMGPGPAGPGHGPADMAPAWSGPGAPPQRMLPHTGMMMALEDDQDDWSEPPPPARQGAALLEELDLPRTGQFEALEEEDEYPAQKRRQKKKKKSKAAPPRMGRRRGSSKDRRQWFGISVVVLVAAGAIVGVLKFAFPSHNGPAHTVAAPSKVGAFTLKPNLAQQMNVASLVSHMRKMSGGQATNLVSGVYSAGNMAPGSTNAQIFMFIGGHLANPDPTSSINGFITKFPGAKLTPPGTLGGKTACVETSASAKGKGSVAMCIWFDNDSFGELVSPTMTSANLQNVLVSVRPSLEVVAKD